MVQGLILINCQLFGFNLIAKETKINIKEAWKGPNILGILIDLSNEKTTCCRVPVASVHSNVCAQWSQSLPLNIEIWARIQANNSD